MSSVYKEITLTLTEDEKKILKPAIELCKTIASDCNDEDMFVDASTIFSCIYDNYKNGEISTSIQVYE